MILHAWTNLSCLLVILSLLLLKVNTSSQESGSKHRLITDNVEILFIHNISEIQREYKVYFRKQNKNNVLIIVAIPQ